MEPYPFQTEERADDLFHKMGLNMSEAINVFLYKAILEEGIPFIVSAIRTGINGYFAGEIEDIKTAVIEEIAKKKRQGSPVIGYDKENKKVYLEYPDGKREYVGPNT